MSGNYEIKSSPSGLSLGLQGDSTANAAPVMQNADTGDVGASWALVPESNGYYEIKNALTGQLLNVSAASGAPGALVVQWPADGLVPGNDQWLPVQNPDGSWSFYNRYSQLALDDRQHRRGNEVRAVDAEQHREAGIHPSGTSTSFRRAPRACLSQASLTSRKGTASTSTFTVPSATLCVRSKYAERRSTNGQWNSA